MAEDDASLRDARRAGGLDEFALFQGQGLAAHNAGHGQPGHRAQGDEHQDQVSSEHGHQQDDEEHVGQRIEHIDDAHHQLVHPPADKARRSAPDHPDHQRDRGGDHPDRQGYLQPHQQAREHVAPQGVGAKQMAVDHGFGPGVALVDGVVAEGQQQGADQGGDQQQADQDQAGHGRLVAQQSAARIVPQAAPALGGGVYGAGVPARIEQQADQDSLTRGSSAA